MSHLFLAVPNNSGSTILYNLLAQGSNVTFLRREGQSYAGMPHEYDVSLERMATERSDYFTDIENYRWDITKRAWNLEWERVAKIKGIDLNDDKVVKMEKSPPNVLRVLMLNEQFEDAYFILSIRDPYAFCEGTRRKGLQAERKDYSLERCAAHWLRVAAAQRENMQYLADGKIKGCFFRYEDMCDRPKDVAKIIMKNIPDLSSLGEDFLTKDQIIDTYTLNLMEVKLENQNSYSISRLSRSDIQHINQVLSNYQHVLEFFGYNLVNT